MNLICINRFIIFLSLFCSKTILKKKKEKWLPTWSSSSWFCTFAELYPIPELKVFLLFTLDFFLLLFKWERDQLEELCAPCSDVNLERDLFCIYICHHNFYTNKKEKKRLFLFIFTVFFEVSFLVFTSHHITLNHDVLLFTLTLGAYTSK